MSSNLNLPDPALLEMDDIPPALAQLAAFQTALSARLIIERTRPGEKPEREEDTLLTASEAAKILNVEVSWLYKRSKQLPFVRKFSRKNVKYSRNGLNAWIARRRA